MDLSKLTREELIVFMETKREDDKRAVQVFASVKDLDQPKDRGLIIKMIASKSTKDRDQEHISVVGWHWPDVLPKLQYAHQYREPRQTIGRLLEVTKDVPNDSLIIVAEMANKIPNHDWAALTAELLLAKFLDQGSVGFIPEKWVNADKSEGSLEKDGWPWPQMDRTYTQQELIEHSIVPVPSQRGSVVQALKGLPGVSGKSLLDELMAPPGAPRTHNEEMIERLLDALRSKGVTSDKPEPKPWDGFKSFGIEATLVEDGQVS